MIARVDLWPNEPDGANGWLPVASAMGFCFFMVWFPFFGLTRPAVAHPAC